jgi:hypothetical protein
MRGLVWPKEKCYWWHAWWLEVEASMAEKRFGTNS